MRPLALYQSHDIKNDKEKFIAIAEGIDLPLYAFTYGIEMIQFYYEDPTASLDNFFLDHSIIARKHAQTVANLIAAEARMNDHSFDSYSDVSNYLIRHEELAQISYKTHKDTLPAGM